MQKLVNLKKSKARAEKNLKNFKNVLIAVNRMKKLAAENKSKKLAD
jgi:hypothetical protein